MLVILAWSCGTGKPQRYLEDFRVEPSTLSFGDVVVGGVASLATVIENRGSDRVHVELLEIPEGFAVQPRGGGIPPGGTLALEVTFAPKGVGASSGAIRFRSRFSGEDVVLQVEGTGVPSVSPGSEALDFGDVFIGKSKTLVLPIVSAADFPIEVELSAAGDLEFSVSRRRFELSPRGAEALDVTFTPRRATYASASIEIVPCFGCAATAVSLRGRGTDRPLVATPPSLDFGLVPPGLVARRTLALANEGVGPISLAPASLAAAEGSPFAIESLEIPDPLEEGGVGEIVVTFSPEVAGPHEASIRLHDVDGLELLGIPVVGRGGGPLLQVSPSRIDFGVQPQGRELERTVRIENVGERASAWLRSVSIEGGGADAFALDLPALPADVGLGPREMKVRVRGDRAGEWKAEVVFHTDLAAQPTLRLPLSLITAAPMECDLRADRAELRFGAVELMYEGTRSVHLTNHGTEPCLLWGVSVEGDASKHFKQEITLVDPLYLPPGQVLSVPIRFDVVGATIDVLLQAELIVHRGSLEAEPMVVPISGMRKRWSWGQEPILPVFEPTPVDRATVATAGIFVVYDIDLRLSSISQGSSPAFRFPVSQDKYCGTSGPQGCNPYIIKVAFVPEVEGIHRGQLELRERWSTDEPYIIELEAVAEGPCDGCDWPIPHCLPETSAPASTEVSYADDWPHECNWAVVDPESPRGGLDRSGKPYEMFRKYDGWNSCSGALVPYVVGDFTLGNLRVRPDGRAAYCENTVHSLPREGLWVEATYDMPENFYDWLHVRVLRGGAGDPALKTSWFDENSACPPVLPSDHYPSSCAWGEEGIEDDPIFLGVDGVPPSQRFQIQRPTMAHPYFVGVLANGGISHRAVDVRIFCGGTLVAQPSVKFFSSSNDFNVLGSVQFTSPATCTFTPSGVTWPFLPLP